MKIFIIFFATVCFCSHINSQDKQVDISGYFLTSAGVLHLNHVESSSGTFYLGRSTLRLNIVRNDKECTKLDISTDFNILYGVYSDLFQLKSDFVEYNNDIIFSVDIRKMYLMLKYSIFDFYIGRQLLRFAEGYIFNPLNPFSKIDFTDINFIRRGVDALRLKFQLSDTAFLEQIFIPKTKLTQSDFATRIILPLFGWDFSLNQYYRGKLNWTSLGFSFKGDAILGLYSEFLYNYTPQKDKRFFSYMIGADYSFKKKLILRTEYTYNSYNIENFTQEEILYISNFPFVSQQYLALQTIYVPNIINSFNFSFITNLQNLKNFLILSYQRNLFSNLNLLATLRYVNKDFLYTDYFLNSETIIFLLDLVLRY